MKTILIIGILFCVYKILSALSERSKADRAERERQRIRDEQASIRAEQERQKAQIRAEIERAKLETHERIEAEKRRIEWQKRQDEINRKAEAERIRLAKEQERQAEQLARHEEQLMKLDHRLASAESEIAFNREQRERIFSLLEIEYAERDACIKGSSAWQKHQAKVISLENKVHTVQKRIDKAQADKRFCESKLA